MSKPPIVLVSTNKDARSLAKQALERRYALEVTADPTIALGMLTENHRMALVEFDMPDMNGLEFLREVRIGRSGGRRSLSVGMMTGFADNALFTAAISLDLNALLLRPLSVNELLRRATRMATEEIEAKPMEDYAAVTIPLSDSQIAQRAPGDHGVVAVRMPEPKRPAATAEGTQARGQPAAAPLQFGPLVRRPIEAVGVGWQIGVDVLGPGGVCLIAAGTALTARLVKRLNDLAGTGAVCEVWARAPITQNRRRGQSL